MFNPIVSLNLWRALQYPPVATDWFVFNAIAHTTFWHYLSLFRAWDINIQRVWIGVKRRLW